MPKFVIMEIKIKRNGSGRRAKIILKKTCRGEGPDTEGGASIEI
jgi:hypothetical protein